MGKIGKTFQIAFSCMLALTLSVTAFVPFPKLAGSADERYRCEWENGAVTEESFASAYAALVGTDGENIYLNRDGIGGTVAPQFEEAYDTLKNGSLAEILSLRVGGTRLDRAALYREFSDTLWYDREYYGWTGERIERTRAGACGELTVFGGDVTARILRDTGAERLVLKNGASVTAAALCGSSVAEIAAEAPYRFEGGLLYLDTAGGVRLVAGVPALRNAVVGEDTAFYDEGALLPCDRLETLTLPFAGSEREASSYYRGEFAHLFSDGEYRVPHSLKTVRVTGGRLVSHAFYACGSIEEVNVCGVSADAVSATAFVGLTSLKRLHTPRRDVMLPSSARYLASAAPCGCTVYEIVSRGKNE